jgi:hypothetical protein
MNDRRNILKNVGIMVITLALLFAGIAMADPGVNQTFETQGVSMVTSIQAEGNMYSATDVTWTQSSDIALTEVPPSPESGSYYVSTYSEDTMSSGNGLIGYDKSTQLDTGSRLNGQYNIEATKEISFIGENGAEITSTDNIFLDGTGTASETEDLAICIFAAGESEFIPAFCNTVEAGSSFTMSVVNARTETRNRFVTDSADTPVALTHDIRVDTLGDIPSIGKVSAFMKGMIMEGRDDSTDEDGSPLPYETVEFTESTDVDGYITLFDKNMDWVSGIKRV